MNAYCPYSNIKEGHLYPHMLIVGGMNDPRVAYFEPAKWTAKLRAKARWSSKADDKGDGIKSTAATTTDADRMLLLRIQDAGHGGNSGQYASFEDLAFEYAFLISALGAQFRPVSSGGRSATGVDYDMYWAELEKEVGAEGNDEDDEDDAAEERAPSTPLQRLSAFFGRRKSGKRPSSADTGTTATPSDSRPSSSHRRSPSSLLSGIKNLGVALRRPSSQQQVIIASPTVTPASAVAVEAPALPVAAKPGTTSALAVTQPSPATSNTSAKGATTHAAIMRHPSINHEQEEASGRVQSSGKLYRFMAKFV